MTRLEFINKAATEAQPDAVNISGDPVIDRVLTWVRDTFPGARMDRIQQPDIPDWLVEPLRQTERKTATECEPSSPTPEEAKALRAIQEMALNLIRATQSELAGIRDGSLLPNRWTDDGFYIWYAPDAVTSLANEIHQAVKNLRERATEEEREDDHFGLCPVCHKSDGYLNIGKTHMGVCHEHKKAWPVGMNLFSSWEHETEEDWKRNAKILVEYEEVEGFTYPRPAPAKPVDSDHFPDIPF